MNEEFQESVVGWVREALGEEGVHDTHQRRCRFLEESLELVQAVGGTKEEALQLVEYVFSRPTGEIHQEIGGAGLTLIALCGALNMPFDRCLQIEFTRCNTPEIIERIRQKHASRKEGGPLPGNIETSLATDETSR